jgi:DNA-binding beta-propeller fold protein YncE
MPLLPALAFAVVLATGALKVAFSAPTPWAGDWGFVLGPAIMVAAATRLFALRRWRQGIAAAVVLVPVHVCIGGMAWLISGGVSQLRARATQGPQWQRAQANLPEGMGSPTVSMRSLEPLSFIPVPGPHLKPWQVEFRPARGGVRTIRLPDMTTGLEIDVAAARTQAEPILHLSCPGAGAADAAAVDLYLDPASGSSVEPIPGPERVLGRFDMMDIDGPRFIPHYDQPSAAGELPGLAECAAAPDGGIYVADDRTDEVLHYAADGSFLQKWPLADPYGIGGLAVDASGNVWVARYAGSTLQEYTSDGQLLAEYRADVEHPSAIAVSAQGDLLVADFNGRVGRITPDGRLVSLWGPRDEASRRAKIIFCGIAVAPSGEVVVTDRGADRVRVYSPDGTPLRDWRVGDAGIFKRTTPLGVAIDTRGRVNVVAWSSGNLSVEEYRLDGMRLRHWPLALGERNMRPVPIVVSDRYVWVGDRIGARVLRFTRSGTPAPEWGSAPASP